MEVAHVRLDDVAGDCVAAGRQRGERHAVRILDRAAQALEVGGIALLDFEGIDVVTSSYFAAAGRPLWERRDGFPVLCRCNDIVTEEVSFVFQNARSGAWHVDDEGFTAPALLGAVDDAHRKILETVLEHGSVSAGELYSMDRSIRQTAWSNRLADLQGQRLLRPNKVGRQLIFTLPWQEVEEVYG